MQELLIADSDLGEDCAKGIFGTVVRNENSASVIDEVMEVEQVHRVVQQL